MTGKVYTLPKTQTAPAKPQSKAAQKRETSAKVGRGLRRLLNKARRPSDCTVTSF
jgi:hypothetical protein